MPLSHLPNHLEECLSSDEEEETKKLKMLQCSVYDDYVWLLEDSDWLLIQTAAYQIYRRAPIQQFTLSVHFSPLKTPTASP